MKSLEKEPSLLSITSKGEFKRRFKRVVEQKDPEVTIRIRDIEKLYGYFCGFKSCIDLLADKEVDKLTIEKTITQQLIAFGKEEGLL